MARRLASVLTLALFLMVVDPSKAQLVVGSNPPGTTSIRLVDLTGAMPVRLLVTANNNVARPRGMAADELTATLYWTGFDTLYKARYASNGALNAISVGLLTSEGLGTQISGLAFDSVDDKLYGFGASDIGGIFEIDRNIGTGRLVFHTPANASFGGFDFDPVTDAFYGINNLTGLSGRGLYRISKPLATATFTRIAAYPTGETDLDGLAIGNGRAYMVNDRASEPIYVFNLNTLAYESPITNPNNGTGGHAAGAWAPGLLVTPIGVDLISAMSDSPDCVVGANGTIIYAVTVTNAGPDTAHNVIVTDRLPAGATFIGSSPTGVLQNDELGEYLTVNLGAITAGGSAALAVSVSPQLPGTFTNRASATADELDLISANGAAEEQTTVLAGIATNAAAKGVLSTIAGSSSSLVSGLGGARFNNLSDTLRRPYRSPNGQRWIMGAYTNLPGNTNQVILSGLGVDYSVAVQEGVTRLPDRNDLIGGQYGIDDTMSINDAGDFSFSGDTNSLQWVVAKRIGGQLTVVARAGNPAPALPGLFYLIMTSSQIHTNGSISFFTFMQDAQGSTSRAILGNNGNAPIARVFVDRPTGQCCNANAPYSTFDYEEYGGYFHLGYSANAAGTSHMLTGGVNIPNFLRLATVDGAVIAQETAVLPNSQFTSPTAQGTPIRMVYMEDDGAWYAYGSNQDGQDWVVRNGTVIAMTGASIAPTSPETWSELPYPQTYFLACGNPRGDYVVGGTTNMADLGTNGAPTGSFAATRLNAVVVLNGMRVIARENDPVDLDNNGVFDDGVYIRTFLDDQCFLTDDELWCVVRLRDQTAARCVGADVDIGQALIRIPLSPPITSGDVNCDGTIDGADIAAFVTAALEPTNYATLYPHCNILNADANGDGVVTAADAAGFAGMLIGG